MKWILNIKKGTTVNHPVVGKIEGGTAYQVEDEYAMQVKNILNIVIFDDVVPMESVKKEIVSE